MLSTILPNALSAQMLGSRKRRAMSNILPASFILSSYLTFPFTVKGEDLRYFGSYYNYKKYKCSSTSSFAFCSAFRSIPSSIPRSIFSTPSSWSEDTPIPPRPFTIDSLAKKLANSEYKNVVVLIGAGASVSAGIPDFRTPGTGLYDSLQKYNLPMPESIFDLDYYRQNPLPFVDLCRSIWPGKEGGPRPTITHTFLKLLQEKNALRRIYTQNIDGLEALAGVETSLLVECHGHFRTSSCISCRAPSDDCQATVLQGEVPKCNQCGSLVKPDIVFFGEELPKRFQNLIDDDMEECDLLLVIGTSLLVMPVAAIPSFVNRDCPRVMFNREKVGFTFSPRQHDLFVQGDCDDNVRNLCQLSGWDKQLEAIHQSARIS